MAVFKCKMCGGTLDVHEGMTVCECEYCGSKQTVPQLDDEKKINLFSRANRLRSVCEFDKAYGVYETIISDFPEEAEAYWGLLLCKYGIEYVDDPKTGRKIPTCHRSSFDSIMDDQDFDMVMEYSDPVSRAVYREEAKIIEGLRVGINEVSSKEDPYDIFICYKETDAMGERTLDSVIAQDVYDALVEKGYKVFFSRITLEDKLGQEYEPYIFAALNSAKVMLVFGTDYEYFNAVWVKNEWSRFLSLIEKGAKKTLIPCFKGVDAYDMPKEFAKLQAQDMGKIGAIQDLLRGISKLIGKEMKSQQTDASSQMIRQQVSGVGANAESLINRGYMLLEEGAYEEAKDYFDRALDINSQEAEAYLGLFMAAIAVKNRTEAKEAFVSDDYTVDRNWVRAKQYSVGELSEELKCWEMTREAYLQDETDEKKRIRDEIEHKKKEHEEEIRIIEAEINELPKQFESGDFDFTEDERLELNNLRNAAEEAHAAVSQAESSLELAQEKKDIVNLGDEIQSKELYLKELGVFKGKEKKDLQIQIDTLSSRLEEAKKKMDVRCRKIDWLKEKAALRDKELEKYKTKVISRKRASLQSRIDLIKLEMAVEGTEVQFGHYQRRHGIDSREWKNDPIKWIVLNRKIDKVLLISKDGIDCQEYNKQTEHITWEHCSLRAWLNSQFISTAFSDKERQMIRDTECNIPTNLKYSTNPGNATVDKIFLLSIDEVEKLLLSDDDRICTATAYAKAHGAITSGGRTGWESQCVWWLRSPGESSDKAATISSRGEIHYSGYAVRYQNCVRPALWINLQS